MPEVLNLLDSSWVLTSGDTEAVADLPASALQILCRDGTIKQNPLHRYGERELHWVSERAWKFERHFDISDEMLQYTNVDLLLSGLDTIARVSVNGHKVLHADNAFRSFRVTAKQYLRQGCNSLEIVIQPASEVARARFAAYPYKVPAVQQTPEDIFGAPGNEERYNFVRKPACDFGWDWGPSFSQAGVYGPVSLNAYSYSHLTGVNVRQKTGPHGGMRLTVVCQLQVAQESAGGKLFAVLSHLSCSARKHVEFSGSGCQEAVLQVDVSQDAALWWPMGYGSQALHELDVTFIADPIHPASATVDQSGNTGSIAENSNSKADSCDKKGNHGDNSGESNKTDSERTSSVRKRIGLKSVELLTKPLPDGGGKGETFSFSVNGVPIWIKGSNVIPSSVYVTEETEERQRLLVDAAVASHQNTLRVWGGGRYPTQAFMDACDEAGVLVWLELMFACALYPADATFIGNVGEEVRQQMFRLQGHACVFVLGGNNEVENSFGWFPSTSAVNPSLYAVDFSRLFVDAIRPIVEKTGPDIYLDTSPSNGVWSTEPFVKRWDADADNKAGVNDPRWGDVHFYDYPANGFDPNTYPRAKFVSEFGWQSWPSWPGFRKCIDPKEDCGWDSQMSVYRQRHPEGQPELKQQICSHFPVGSALNTSQSGFQRWIYLTQLHQAMAYDTAIRYWRRIKYDPDACTMGALYWQLNDIWEGASWSSINHDGSWKLLHHVITRAYAPLVVSANIDKEGQLAVWVVSDSIHLLEGNLRIEVVPWNADEESYETTADMEFHVEPRGVCAVEQWSVAQLLSQLGLSHEDAFIRVSVTSHGDTQGAEQQQIGQPYHSSIEVHLTELKDARLNDPCITIASLQQLSPTQVSFEVSVSFTAVGVALETELPGRFTDNAFHVVPWQPITVSFISASADVSAEALHESLSVQSLYDAT